MKTIVGLFDNRQQAEACVRDLETAGYGRDRVSMVAGTAATSPEAGGSVPVSPGEGAGTGAIIGGVAGGAAGLLASLAGLAIPGIGPVIAAGPIIAGLTGAGVGAAVGGLFGALTTAGVPDEHAHYYAEGVRRGGTLVTASSSDDDAERVMDIMNRHRPIDIEDRAATWRQSGFTTPTTGSTRVGGETAFIQAETSAVGGETTRVGGEFAVPGSQTLPVVEEELKVGKREVETGGVRVHARTQETPVEEKVQLHEEHVRVERRAADRPATAGDFDQAFRGGTIEVTERAEEAVVHKEARVVEEVVVNKEATERTETVRDTVRKTDVQIQPVEVGSTGLAGSSGFDTYEADFRSNFQTTHRGSDYAFDDVKPAYHYGYELASNRNEAGDWSSIEPDARTRWEQRNPGTWEKVKDAARYAYDRARSKTHS